MLILHYKNGNWRYIRVADVIQHGSGEDASLEVTPVSGPSFIVLGSKLWSAVIDNENQELLRNGA